MKKRSPDVIFIQASEMLGLRPGYYTPEVHDFRMKLRISKNDGRLIVELDGQTVELERDSALRLTRTGIMSHIKGPSQYSDPIRRELAKSSFGQRILEISNGRIEFDSHMDAKVLSEHGNWSTFYGKVPANTGKLVVVYGDAQTSSAKAAYKKFVVRETAMSDPMVHEWFKSLAQKFPQKPSGAFDNALRQEWEPFALQAAKGFYADQARKSAILGMQPAVSLQPVA